METEVTGMLFEGGRKDCKWESASDHQKLKKAKKKISPVSSRRHAAGCDLDCRVFDLQNCKKINLCEDNNAV